MENILVIGGAGFVGSNIADYYLSKGKNVIVFDDFSRSGTEKNKQWLEKRYPEVKFVTGDISKEEPIKDVIRGVDAVFHMASQVAVTTSVKDPIKDFKINALGTLNILEDIRRFGNNPAFVFASTNKVYGAMENVEITEKENKYEYKDMLYGISEDMPLDFHSPYGCSKGAADQYVRDYHRIYGLNNVVFRKSCIYGYRQFGTEDQGWVAWLSIAALMNKPITIYGDGKQVRDVLFISDLVRAYDSAVTNINKTRGQIYNIGGGQNNTLSVLSLLELLKNIYGKDIPYSFSGWRPGDQKVCIMDIRKAKKDLGWEPQIGVEEGVRKLTNWIKETVDSRSFI